MMLARTTSLLRALPVVAIAVVGFTACGKSTSTPTSPTTTTATASPITYLGNLSVSGAANLGGSLQLTASQSATAARIADGRRGVLSRIHAWVEPTLHAQARVAATGMLITTGGAAVPLSGTFSAGVFSMAGGGYGLTATVSGGGISGSGTAPGGLPTVVSAQAPPPPAVPPPSDPSGTYRGSFRIDTVLVFRNTFPSGGVSQCTFNLAIIGTLTMDLQNLGSGQVKGHLAANWQETEVSRTCSFAFTGVGVMTSGIDFQGPVTNLQVGRVESGTGGGDGRGTITRTQGFSGVVSGNTILGTVSRSFNFTTPIATNPGETHVEGYPVSSVSVTLTRG